MFQSSVLGEMRIGIDYPYKDLVVEARIIMPFYVDTKEL